MQSCLDYVQLLLVEWFFLVCLFVTFNLEEKKLKNQKNKEIEGKKSTRVGNDKFVFEECGTGCYPLGQCFH